MIYAANFKMNHTRAGTKRYIDELLEGLDGKNSDDRVIVFPPASALDKYDDRLTIGAQNAYPAQNGAYTGEIGLQQLDEFGIDTILIGHSERRTILKEDQESVAEKFSFFKKEGFEIIYCIGEPIEIRQKGDDAVVEYLISQFEGIDTEYDRLIVAYEPIWAIGTGRSATAEEIASTHKAIKRVVNAPLLYGGSVKPENTGEISSIDNVDGVLVGSAALSADGFLKIIRG